MHILTTLAVLLLWGLTTACAPKPRAMQLAEAPTSGDTLTFIALPPGPAGSPPVSMVVVHDSLRLHLEADRCAMPPLGSYRVAGDGILITLERDRRVEICIPQVYPSTWSGYDAVVPLPQARRSWRVHLKLAAWDTVEVDTTAVLAVR